MKVRVMILFTATRKFSCRWERRYNRNLGHKESGTTILIVDSNLRNRYTLSILQQKANLGCAWPSSCLRTPLTEVYLIMLHRPISTELLCGALHENGSVYFWDVKAGK